jgi:lipoate-protein ligase A
MHTVRLLPFAAASGPLNMARDEALLHAAAGRGVASLRFYTWVEPTLTLGYFQPSGDRLPGVAWVRRPTGGAALVHDPAHDLTYSLALPPGSDWHPPGESWVCRVHHAIRDGLAPLGVTAKAVVCGEERKLGEVLCFLHHTPGDLVCGGSKVAGSAQRRWKGALLQHGSVLLGRSPLTPHLPGIRELSGVGVSGQELAAAVVERLGAVTGWRVEPGDWTPAELAVADRAHADKYTSAEWNDKR